MELGVNTVFAIKRWPDPYDWAKIVARDFGVNIVQVSTDSLDPNWPEQTALRWAERVKDACQNFGIKIDSFFNGFGGYLNAMALNDDIEVRAHALRWVHRAVNLSGVMGAEAFGAYAGALSAPTAKSPQARERAFDQAAEFWAHVAVLAKRAGLTHILFEPTPVEREIPHGVEESLRLVHRVSEISSKIGGVPAFLNFDVGHVSDPTNPVTPQDVLSMLGEVILDTKVVHVQQTDGKYDRHWPFTEEFADQGIVVPQNIVSLIEHVAPEIRVILELIHFPEEPDENVLHDWKTSCRVWRDAMQGASYGSV